MLSENIFSNGLFLQVETAFSFEWPLSRICLAIFLFLLGTFYINLFWDKKNRATRLMIPERKRTAVPWNLTDVLFIAICFFTFPVILFSLIPLPDQIINNLNNITIPDGTDLAKAHPISELMARAANSDYAIPIFLIAFLTGVIAAPLTEEFLFRVVFQGTLEKEIPELSALGKNESETSETEIKSETNCPKKSESVLTESESQNSESQNSEITKSGKKEIRNFEIQTETSPASKKTALTSSSCGNFKSRLNHFRHNIISILVRSIVIVLPALLFAAIHARNPNETRDIGILLKGFCVIPIAYFLTLLTGILWLRKVRKAQWTDFGLPSFQNPKEAFRQIVGDFFRGATGFILLAPIIFGLLKLLNDLFPHRVNDPGAIFILALVLGFFYLKTHSWTVVFFLHFCLNLSSFIVVLLSV